MNNVNFYTAQKKADFFLQAMAVMCNTVMKNYIMSVIYALENFLMKRITSDIQHIVGLDKFVMSGQYKQELITAKTNGTNFKRY